MSENLIGECRGKWRGILIALGIDGALLTGKHRPCPICGGKDRFRFDDKAGSGSWYCNQCRAGYGIHLVQKAFGWSYRRAASEIEGVLGGDTVRLMPDEVQTEPKTDLLLARKLWRASRAIRPDDVVGRYLTARCVAPSIFPDDLSCASSVLYLDDGEFLGRFPAMLALVRGSDFNPVGVHRTYLGPAGGKADVPAHKKMMGSLPPGAAVRLAEHGVTLGIAEGIETALAAATLFAVPCWSALNSQGLAAWSPPAGVTNVVVFGDNDSKFGGQAAAWSLAHRLACKGLSVRVDIPDAVGSDWNDVLINRRDHMNCSTPS